MIEAKPGTYALILHASQDRSIEVGRLGTLLVEPGFYIYVGSALGPGGLRARIRHHQHIAERPHWHIDYLRRVTELIEVWVIKSTRCHEHRWADLMAKSSQTPLLGFGSSDCDCEAHLFWSKQEPSLRSFRNAHNKRGTIQRISVEHLDD